MRQTLPGGFIGLWHATDIGEILLKRMRVLIKAFGPLVIGALVASCGSGGGGGTDGGGVSPQVVSGVAATGAPLAGQVTLRDSSTVRKDKVTIVGSDGSFAIDVADMTAPFILKATGTADGVSRTMFSFAGQAGTANINPFSSVAVANAAGVDDPAVVFEKPDAATLNRIKSAMPGSVATLQSMLKPLLDTFSASSADPVKDRFTADHTGLDGVFDNVKIAVVNGVLTITNATTGAVIFTAQIKDIKNGHFTDNDDDLPKRGPRPAAPANVTATGGSGQISVSWDPVANATSYDIFYAKQSNVATREDEEDEDAKRVKNVTSPYVLTGLAPSTTYFFMVRAIVDDRRSAASAEVSATTNGTTPAPTVPAAPTGVSATGGTNQVTVSWPVVTGANSYNLYWSTTDGVTVANGTKIAGVTSPAVHAGLANKTTYFYVVTAVNAAGESAASVQVAATTLDVTVPPVIPSAPTGVTATGGANQVTLSWTAVSNASSYNVYWSTTSGVTTSSGTKIAGVSSPFVQTGRADSTAYFYIVTAVNAAGESSPSVQATATPSVIPSAPTGVVAIGGTKQATISWAAVLNATSYNLYWSTASGVTVATGTKIAGVTSPFVQSGLADSTAYFYIVTAVNGAGESVASSQATATTNTPAIDGAALYNQNCSGCHGPLGSSDHQGASAQLITSAIANIRAMRSITLTTAEIAAISAALQ